MDADEVAHEAPHLGLCCLKVNVKCMHLLIGKQLEVYCNVLDKRFRVKFFVFCSIKKIINGSVVTSTRKY